MRGNKFEKSHIHFLESETLSRESRVTESVQEIVDSNTFGAHITLTFINCQQLYTICVEV